MPVTYRFDSNIVIIEMAGEYSLSDIRNSILTSLADSTCPSSPFILVNLSESRSIYTRSSEDIKSMVRSLASLVERFNNRIAFVTPNDLLYGLMRMGSVFSEDKGMKTQVFRSFEDARKWLLS